MTPEQTVSLLGDAVKLVILMVGVLIVPSLIVGLVVSIFQAATQIQEQTLSSVSYTHLTLPTFHSIFASVPGLIG